MKKLLLIWLLSGMFFSAATAQYDDALPTGYEGDYFSLEGALDLFKNSRSLDQFERKLNTRDNWVNNLDLNYDGRTDYIRVEHRRQGDFHAIILQALVGTWEVQDVAVIEIEKVSRRDAILQIIGDEDLYGEEVIVEAYDRNTLVSRGRNYRSDYGYRTNYVNVYHWSPIQFIFGRNYVRYVSPFHHHYYPSWYSSWDRCHWDVFRPRIRHYHAYYRPVRIHRVINVHHFYKPQRAYCHTVLAKTNKVRVKHGKKTINRPRYDRNKVSKENRISSRTKKGDRAIVRNVNKKSTVDRRKSVKKSTDYKRGSDVDRKRRTKEVKRSTSYSNTNGRAERSNVTKKSSRSNAKSKRTKASNYSGSSYSKSSKAKSKTRTKTKTKSQSRTRKMTSPSTSRKSSVSRTTKKSKAKRGVNSSKFRSKNKSSKKKSTTKKSRNKRRQ
jgi:hypothetical protein